MNKYHMRKQERQINDTGELNEILQKGKYAVISLCRENEPYIVTLSYGYDKSGNSLYFHTALAGLKLEFIRQNPNACATVIEDKGYIMNACAHRYRSVVLYGRMEFVEAIEEKKRGMEILLNHLEENPDIVRERSLKNERVYDNMLILKLSISEMTGKKGR